MLKLIEEYEVLKKVINAIKEENISPQSSANIIKKMHELPIINIKESVLDKQKMLPVEKKQEAFNTKFICPNCKESKDIKEAHKYCHWCGQKFETPV